VSPSRSANAKLRSASRMASARYPLNMFARARVDQEACQIYVFTLLRPKPQRLVQVWKPGGHVVAAQVQAAEAPMGQRLPDRITASLEKLARQPGVRHRHVTRSAIPRQRFELRLLVNIQSTWIGPAH
jgi:hypothetical protein